ncbi:hypothetical protein F4821DRAFT_252400, partial [Hypoxylon rubiginosum]
HPDCLDFVQAEHAIREALIKFQGNQERYIRNYILTRSLDPRVEKTPRASLIRSSFQHGGPLALIGIFCATMDAHRNSRSRETLNYLLNRASNESQLALVRRANTFPCHSTIADWLSRIYDKVEPDAQGLACILWWLGTPSVPLELFRRARLSSRSWDTNGEVLEVSTRIISLIKDEGKFGAAMRSLESVGFIKPTQTGLDMNMRVADLLMHRLQAVMWLPKVAKAIFHALPKLGSDDLQQCKALLPHAARILTHLDHQQVAILLDQMDLTELIEACLSLSHFRDQFWKMQILSIATQAIKTSKNDATEIALLKARVDTRKYFLSVVYPDVEMDRVPVDEIVFPVVDRRSNAFTAELAIAQARKFVQLDQLTPALEHLDRFTALDGGRPSTLERLWLSETALTRARILRFGGHFRQAHDILLNLPQQWLLLSVVLCELGECDEAIGMLQTHIATVTHTMRPRLVLAHAYRLKCMHALLGGQTIDQDLLQKSNDMYDDIGRHYHPTTYFEKMDYLSILIGLAILQHMRGRVEQAIDAWKTALTASTRWLPTGYTDMIISYSLSELEARRGCPILADILAAHARMLSNIGRQHHFIGLGSVWPDIVGKWRFTQGLDPIILETAARSTRS